MKNWFGLLSWALPCLAGFTEHCLLYLVALPPERRKLQTSSVPVAKAVMDSSRLPGYRSEWDSWLVKLEGFHNSSESGNVTVLETVDNAVSHWGA